MRQSWSKIVLRKSIIQKTLSILIIGAECVFCTPYTG